jgi:hypothetical protein
MRQAPSFLRFIPQLILQEQLYLCCLYATFKTIYMYNKMYYFFG